MKCFPVCVSIFLYSLSSFCKNVAGNQYINMFSDGTGQFSGKDKSADVFGDDINDTFPVAYFDVNSDKLTDLVTVSKDRTSIVVFLAATEQPYLRRAFVKKNITKTYNKETLKIVSVRAGDFTGNGLADLMVTLGKDEYTWEEFESGYQTAVQIVFCSIHLQKQKIESLECEAPGSGAFLGNLTQEPNVLDVNGDMVLDLVGEKWAPITKAVVVNGTTTNKTYTIWQKQRMVWFSESTRDSFEWTVSNFTVVGPFSNETFPMANVSCNAYADIDGDSIPEFLVLSENSPRKNTSLSSLRMYYLETYEIIKNSNEQHVFQLKKRPKHVNTSPQDEIQVIGQPMIIDLQHNGNLEQLFPFCTNIECSGEFGIYVMDGSNAFPLPLGSLTYEGIQWTFIPPQKPPHTPKKNSTTTPPPYKMEYFYSRALSLRVGDYNLDGYPDLLGVLKTKSRGHGNASTRAVLFENVPCVPQQDNPCHFNRTFNANFDIFKNYKNVISASFYDIGDNGALDVLLVTLHGQDRPLANQTLKLHAFENGMTFDASFLKVMVLTGQPCLACDEGGIPYGNVLPGATIHFTSLNAMGKEESGVAVQTYRTAHMPLDLPCNVFGIGHSPNFIETLSVTISPSSNESNQFRRDWKQIIPNSQIVVVPYPLEKPHHWTMLLFLTPSDVVLKTFGILVGVCLVLATIVGALETKEKIEDKRARQTEAHRMMMWLS